MTQPFTTCPALVALLLAMAWPAHAQPPRTKAQADVGCPADAVKPANAAQRQAGKANAATNAAHHAGKPPARADGPGVAAETERQHWRHYGVG